jgi:hypothetical protein
MTQRNVRDCDGVTYLLRQYPQTFSAPLLDVTHCRTEKTRR